MKHSALNRGVMRDWLQVAIESGSNLPTDAAIMDRFGFTSAEQARTLLADLADRGDITIRWQGDERVITLGRTKSGPLPSAPRPQPSAKKLDPQVQAAVDKIKTILNRDGPPSPAPDAVPARAERAKAASVALKKPSVSATKPASADLDPARPFPPGQRIVGPYTVPAPKAAPAAPKAPPVAPKPEPVAPKGAGAAPPPKPRTPRLVPVLAHLLPDVLDELADRASADGMSASALAAQILTAAMRGPGKLLVPAAGFRAAEVAGASVHDFASMLIRRGLQAHLAEAGEA